ncbi:MAG TPA: hypothetical protein VIT23_11495, partial [Terrimicrobiaceae bacterium]
LPSFEVITANLFAREETVFIPAPSLFADHSKETFFQRPLWRNEWRCGSENLTGKPNTANP